LIPSSPAWRTSHSGRCCMARRTPRQGGTRGAGRCLTVTPRAWAHASRTGDTTLSDTKSSNLHHKSGSRGEGPWGPLLNKCNKGRQRCKQAGKGAHCSQDLQTLHTLMSAPLRNRISPVVFRASKTQNLTCRFPSFQDPESSTCPFPSFQDQESHLSRARTQSRRMEHSSRNLPLAESASRRRDSTPPAAPLPGASPAGSPLTSTSLGFCWLCRGPKGFWFLLHRNSLRFCSLLLYS